MANRCSATHICASNGRVCIYMRMLATTTSRRERFHSVRKNGHFPTMFVKVEIEGSCRTAGNRVLGVVEARECHGEIRVDARDRNPRPKVSDSSLERLLPGSGGRGPGAGGGAARSAGARLVRKFAPKWARGSDSDRVCFGGCSLSGSVGCRRWARNFDQPHLVRKEALKGQGCPEREVRGPCPRQPLPSTSLSASLHLSDVARQASATSWGPALEKCC